MAVESDPKTEPDRGTKSRTTKPEPEQVQPKVEPKIEPKMANHVQSEQMENTGYATIPTETIPPTQNDNERPPGAQEIKRQNNASFDPTEPAVKKPKHEEVSFDNAIMT